MKHWNEEIKLNAIKIVGELLTSNEENVFQVRDLANVIQTLKELIEEGCIFQNTIYWVISNITADSSDAIQMCLDSQLIDIVIQKLMTCGDDKVKLQAVWCVANAVQHCNSEQSKLLASKSTIRALGVTLTSKLN